MVVVEDTDHADRQFPWPCDSVVDSLVGNFPLGGPRGEDSEVRVHPYSQSVLAAYLGVAADGLCPDLVSATAPLQLQPAFVGQHTHLVGNVPSDLALAGDGRLSVVGFGPFLILLPYSADVVDLGHICYMATVVVQIQCVLTVSRCQSAIDHGWRVTGDDYEELPVDWLGGRRWSLYYTWLLAVNQGRLKQLVVAAKGGEQLHPGACAAVAAAVVVASGSLSAPPAAPRIGTQRWSGEACS